MPTLNKLEYLDETKQQIKGALNTNFNSQITDSDTFRSYVSKISNIYTNWPKVTGEETELTLNNTKKGKMVLDLKGNTLQASEPTPDTPDEPDTPNEPDTPDEPANDNCDHICHKSGFMGFIWKIVKFFSKLFKLNPVCECGAVHY